MIGVLRRLLQDESGAAMTEYALILALLSGPATAVLVWISVSANQTLSNASSALTGFQLGTPPQ